MPFRLQVFSVPSKAGGMRLVGSHFPSGVCGSGARCHQKQCWLSAEQGAAVEDVERSGQHAH